MLFFSIFTSAQEWAISSIPKEVSTNAKAVIQNKETLITLHSIDNMTFERSIVLTIFKEEGDKYGVFPIYYNKSSEIISYTAEVLDSNGKRLKKLKGKDFKDASAVNNGTLYAEDRVKYFNYTPIQYPYTLKISFKIKSSNTAFIPDWVPIPSYGIGIVKDKFTLHNLSDIEVRIKEVNQDIFNINKTELNNKTEYTFKNQSPIKYEYLAPSLVELSPQVYFSPKVFSVADYKGNAESWESFGKWVYNDLLSGTQELPLTEREKVKELIKGVSSDREKIRILYQYMQQKTRYINVSIGIGGWRPYPAESVSKKGYGDCKALTNYMMSLLSEAGINANYTLVYAGTEDKLNIQKDFPSMQGNHAILNVPLKQDTIWLECTSQLTAFNHLGEFTNDRDALSINSTGGTIVRTQQYPHHSNKENIIAEGELKPDGTLLLNFTNVTSGIQYDWNYQVNYEDKNNQINWLQQKYGNLKQKKILDYNFINQIDSAKFIQEVNLSAISYGQLSGKNIIIPSVPLGRSTTSLKKMNNRRYPFKISVGYIDEAIFNLLLPDAYHINYELEPIIHDTEFGFYSLSYKLTGQNLQIIRKLIVKEGLYPKDKFNNYVEFKRVVEKGDKSKLLLEKF